MATPVTETHADQVSGEVFAAGRAASRPARLRVEGALLLLMTDEPEGESEIVTLREVTSRIVGVPRQATLADRRRFVTRDDEGMDRLLRQLGRRPSRLHLWERLTLKRLAIFAVLLVAAGILLRAALPVAADLAANLIPTSWERQIGETAYRQSRGLFLDETTLSPERQDAIRAVYDRLLDASDLDYRPDLYLVSSDLIGANALALPGGPVLVTDEMVALAGSDEELAGVLAHEIAHIEERHGLRKALRFGGWLLLANIVFADSGSLISEAGSLAALTAGQAYSRGFEAEADRRAVALLGNAGMEVEPFIAVMTKLGRNCGPSCDSDSLWVAHPPMSERIETLRSLQP